MTHDEIREVERRLAEPFDPAEVKLKPQAVKGDRALAIHYVDARVIQDRLDEVVGVMNWQDAYECLPDGSVVCTLKVRIGDDWITKMDVGGQSEQPDEGDRRKAAFSDALKRAAVKYGIARYLYRLPHQWLGYDPQKKRFTEQPRLPAWALPRQAAPQPAQQSQTVARADQTPAPAPRSRIPANGQELYQRLLVMEGRLVAEGVCKPGELLACVTAVGRASGKADNISQWDGDGIQLAATAAKRFEEERRASPAGKGGTDTASAPGVRFISPEQVRKLEAELSRTGEVPSRVFVKLNMPKNSRLADLTAEQYLHVMTILEQGADGRAA